MAVLITYKFSKDIMYSKSTLACSKHSTKVKNVEVVDASVNSAKKDRLTHLVNSVLVFPFKWRFDGCFLRLL